MTTATTLDDVFRAQVEPLRRELTAHCYRMLGSAHEAEDLVQETYLRAWRSFHGFEQRASVRTWMYRIATNACLTALEQHQRRPLPTGLGAPNADPTAALQQRPELPWLEPLPDSMVWGAPAADPADQVVTRDSVRLAFVAVLQLLTPRQRAAVILRDVLAWQASEVAVALGVSVAAVNSSLQRGRARLAKHRQAEPARLPDHERARKLLDHYLAAFEAYDVGRIVSLLTEDAVWEMPPFTGWYRGTEDIGRLISDQCPAKGAGDMRLLPTSANGQPVFAVYMRDGASGVFRPFQLQQLTLVEAGVAHVACYFDTTLFKGFDLPEQLEA